MAETAPRIETWCLIPLVRNSDRKAHVAELWSLLRAEIYTVAGAWSGPTPGIALRTMALIEDVSLVPGGWPDPQTGKCCEDESRKYTVLVQNGKVDALREVLERATNSFDQDEILFLVKGVDRSVKRDPGKGFLKGDPAGG